MTTRYVTLAADTPKTVTFASGYDQVAVLHFGNEAAQVYCDTTGVAAVVPTDTEGTVAHTVQAVGAFDRRELTVARASAGVKRTTLSLKSTAAVRVEVEFS
jgi:hypothetical protein